MCEASSSAFSELLWGHHADMGMEGQILSEEESLIVLEKQGP